MRMHRSVARLARSAGSLLQAHVRRLAVVALLASPSALHAQWWIKAIRAGEVAEEAAVAEQVGAAAVRAANAGARTARGVEAVAAAGAAAGAVMSGAELAEEILRVSLPVMQNTVPRASQATVLIGVHDGSLVAVTNVLHDGSHAPVALQAEGRFSLPAVVARIDYEPPTMWERYDKRLEQIINTTNDSTQFVVKQDVFADGAADSIEFGGARHLQLLDVRGDVHPLRRMYDMAAERTLHVADYGTPFYALAADTTAPALLAGLGERRFDRDDVRIISLVRNPSMDRGIDEALPDMRIPLSSFTPDAVAFALGQAEGKHVLVLGYATEAGLQAVDANGRPAFELQLATLRDAARSGNVEVIPLGMNPSELADSTRNRFGQRDVIRRLADAMDAGSLAEFYQRFAGPGVRLLVQHAESAGWNGPVLSAVGIISDSSQFVPMARLGAMGMIPESTAGFWSRHPVIKWTAIIFGVLIVLGMFGSSGTSSSTAATAKS